MSDNGTGIRAMLQAVESMKCESMKCEHGKSPAEECAACDADAVTWADWREVEDPIMDEIDAARAQAQADVHPETPAPGCYICQPDNPDAEREGCSDCERKHWQAVATSHTRTQTEHGPDFCAECSSAAQEWVSWHAGGAMSAPGPGRERFPLAAVRDLREAWEGLPVTPAQERALRWLEEWDQPTLNAIADVIRLARAECPR